MAYPTSPEVVTAVGTEGLLTALQYYADNPQVKKQLYEKHGYRKSLYMILDNLGLGSGVKGRDYAHWENGWLEQTFVVGAVTTASAGVGTTMVISLKAESMLTESIDGTSVPFSYPQAQDIIEMPGTRNKAIILSKDTSVSPHRLTIKPIGSHDLAAFVVADARFFIATDAWAEGTGGAKSRQSVKTRWSNHTQIFKARYSITGSAMTNESIFDIATDKGTIVRETDDAEKRLYNSISRALLIGEKTASVTQSASELDYDPVVKTTQGMINYGVTEGTEIDHTVGGVDMAHFDSIGEIMRGERINSNVISGWLGYSYRTELENMLSDFFVRDLSVYSGKFKPEIMGGSDPNDFFAWLGFSGIHKNGYTFVFNTLDELDDPNGMGAPGYGYSDMGIWMPAETLKSKGEKRDIPSLGFRYKELNGYSRKYEFWQTGGAGPIKKTSSTDIMNSDLRADIGGEYALGSSWVVDFGTSA